MKFVRFFNQNNINCSISNIAHGNALVTRFATPVDVYDVIEDAETSEELLRNLKRLKLVGWNNLEIDRENSKYVRIKGIDRLGNIHYLKVEKEN